MRCRLNYSDYFTNETPQGILAVVGITDGMPELIYKKGFRVLFLDSVQEPGNAGTMIRTAHALGFDAVLTGPGTVDVFNSKALRATMGSIFNIPVLDNIHGNEMLESAVKTGSGLLPQGWRRQSHVMKQTLKVIFFGNRQ